MANLPDQRRLKATGYWVGAHRRILDLTKLAAYAWLAGTAIEAAGGHFLSRNGRVEVHESRVRERRANGNRRV
jgi:uncharacterized protein (DUF1330 family)